MSYKYVVISRKPYNNNNIVICNAHKVSSKAESEASAVARCAALVGYAKRTVLRRRLKVSAVGESLVSRDKFIPDCGCNVAEGSLQNSVENRTKRYIEAPPVRRRAVRQQLAVEYTPGDAVYRPNEL